MKLLLDNAVYEVPTDLLMAWVNMTPKLRDEFRGQWRSYTKQRLGTRIPNAKELESLMDTFYKDHQDWYFQLMFEATMDLKATMGEGFEDYKIDMTVDELVEYADKPNVGSFTPVAKQPIRIDVEGDDSEEVEITINRT